MSVFKLTKEHLDVLEEKKLKSNPKLIEKIVRNDEFYSLDQKDMQYFLRVADVLYRQGKAIISDKEYDEKENWYNENHPESHLSDVVQSDLKAIGKTIKLPQKMLSTDKAYSKKEVEKWLDRILKAALNLNISRDEIIIRVTPKLDGYAAYDDGSILYTRGDGLNGQDITRAFERGLKVSGNGQRGLGPGEIVINKYYFEKNLSKYFENSRNIQAAIIAEKNVDFKIKKAINDGACVFYPFSLIENWTGNYKELLNDFENIVGEIWDAVPYDVDGVILESTDPKIKEYMGATRKFHRWQLAFKRNEEAAEVEVVSVTPQTSRTGRVTPVAELVPTRISGATISRATVHNYQMVKSTGVGPGAVLRVVRSGLVIPKIEEVIKPVKPQLPDSCPSCQSHLIWESDHLICPNKSDCPAQRENTLVYFFKTLGNNDGFGPKNIEKLTNLGVKHIHDVYNIKEHQFASYGFGEKTSKNLFKQLQASRNIEIEDWRFLSAFGVSRLGGGNCEKLLQNYSLTELFQANIDDIEKLDGFAQVSAEAIVEGLANIKEEFFKVYALGFNLSITPNLSEQDNSSSPIAGATIVFTGTMLKGSRGDMEKHAKSLGAKVAKSVTGKTTYLVAGTKVGETKINGAKDKGVQVLSEQEYINLIS
ncbi:DNA ligase [Shewanella submarina]|uniref:DNA ligase n=1 Tax=Shewanella submarina TaxID=2016376 RepID=A0ABV7G957_9GAMM|nr:BRCT domain-containing protein [Shewanella submarina]MCL1036581.1 DNA ligase [Shewanella submarina]